MSDSIHRLGNNVTKLELLFDDIKIPLEDIHEKLTKLEIKIDDLTAKVEGKTVKSAELPTGE